MSTAVFELASSIPSRVSELNILVQQAKETEQVNEELYNALCRATSVLLASHLEGFIKELTEALVSDLYVRLQHFKHMPKALQYTFCEKIAFYEKVEQTEIKERVKQLIAFFSEYSVPIKIKAFTYKESTNKNATANFIDMAFARIGVPDILASIAGGRFEVVFDNDDQTNVKLLRDLTRMRPFLSRFPDRCLPKHYTPFARQPKSGSLKARQSLWHAYIEEVMIRRHKVAHGETLANETTWRDLRVDIVKLEVLMQGLMYSAASYLLVKDHPE